MPPQALAPQHGERHTPHAPQVEPWCTQAMIGEQQADTSQTQYPKAEKPRCTPIPGPLAAISPRAWAMASSAIWMSHDLQRPDVQA